MSEPTTYGQGFDNLATRWAWIENEHDKMHPDRSKCGGVGGCPMMATATDLEHWMVDELNKWRKQAAPRRANARG